MPRIRSQLAGMTARGAVVGTVLLGAALLGAALLGGALLGVTEVGAATANTAPKALLTASATAANKQTAVHYVASSSIGTESIKITADAAAAKGAETIVLSQGKQTGHISARFVNKTVYFQADTIGLEGYLGMPATLAAKYTGQWISFTSTNKEYTAVSQSMTLKAAVAQISVTAPLSSGGTSTVNGKPTVSVKGTTTSLSSKGNHGPATLYVATKGSPLPVRYTGKGTQKKQKEVGQVDFSKWGETFSVTAPATAISATSISASAG